MHTFGLGRKSHLRHRHSGTLTTLTLTCSRLIVTVMSPLFESGAAVLRNGSEAPRPQPAPRWPHRRFFLALGSIVLVIPSVAHAWDRSPRTTPAPETRQAIDVNRASLEDLRSIRGIGPARARRILAERAHGPFKDLADLSARVPGMGEGTARQLARNGLRVSPP